MNTENLHRYRKARWLSGPTLLVCALFALCGSASAQTSSDAMVSPTPLVSPTPTTDPVVVYPYQPVPIPKM